MQSRAGTVKPMKRSLFILLLLVFLSNCSADEQKLGQARDFAMGFTSWSFGPREQDVDDTYSFIAENADIYAEHLDTAIPWTAWINEQPLPVAFTNEISGRVARKITGKQLLLSVSLLNTNRAELAADYSGEPPNYSSLDDAAIREAYYKHIRYLVGEFHPDYLVIAIEVNELKLRSPEKWEAYKNLITDVRSRIRQSHPDLKISESVSLHNLYEANVSDPQTHVEDIMTHVNKNDFVAVSFYPFLKNLRAKNDFQRALGFLHKQAIRPIALVETAHLAENLTIPALEVSIEGNENEQGIYLETILENARTQGYEFIIWWAHRDFDALWETFPDEVRDIGQLWRDTGLIDETGEERRAFSVWKNNFLN
jgi:hypothetical protein